MGVIARRHGSVQELTLDWPDMRNALGPEEGRLLREALETATGDGDVAAIVLTATGKAFCAGGNLPEIVRLAADGPGAVRTSIYGEFQGIFRAITESPVPIIAGIDGPAIGFGCDLALAGQATFIGARGWLAQGWAKAGLIPATGGALYARRRAGNQTLWRLLAADRVDGPTAEAWQLGIACEEGRGAALAMAAKFAALPAKTVRALVVLSQIDDRDEHLARALDYQSAFLTDPDFAAFAARLLAR